MPDFERITQLAVDAATAFGYVSDPRHLPEFVATMRGAVPLPAGDRVHVTANVDGRHEEGDARFRVDETARRVEWGGADPGYHGSMRIEPIDDRSSLVRLSLHTRGHADEDDVERAMDATMRNLARLLGA